MRTKRFRQCLNMGHSLHVTFEDVYCISSLIKTFYKELPQRLLHKMDLSTFSKSESNAKGIVNFLSEPQVLSLQFH